ncbi:MAG: UDP-N-acetylmuramoyl-L-alanine--D-glutamate ligase [Deltaproteobacteria bacterium]|nr:UDP-N-acetylmuramoyl-L-alanine--D-glutamate ligase [Deltaproteobacteria bacterium]
MELSGTRVMVVGLGVSGKAAARFLASRGASLVLTDISAEVPRTALPDGELHLGGEEPAWLNGVKLVVVSPGVPPSSKVLQAALATRTPIISELELASRFIDAPIVAVTGTNGKSTVTTLIGAICARAGMKTFVGGNLGIPLVEAIGHGFQLAVVEVSSYQLETVQRFKPRIAIHLNLSDDHLDRYRNLEAYGRAKARIFENQDAGDWAILNRDDPLVWPLRCKVKSKVLSFGITKPEPGAGAAIWYEDGLRFRLGEVNGMIGLDGFRLPGQFNRANAMAAAAAALILDLAPELIERTIVDFRGLPHRLEFVRDKDDVVFVDDSKATNVDAVVQALAAVGPSVILIAGGVDKGGSYAALRQVLQRKVKLLLLYGAARETMRADLRSATRLECVQTLRDAVAKAAAEALPGDTVLLSPACASFDQFSNYAERGRRFQELVRAL